MARSGRVSPGRTLRMALGLVVGSVVLAPLLPISTSEAAARALPARWIPFRHLAGVVDLAGPRRDGTFAVAAGGHLALLGHDAAIRAFAQGNHGYATARGPEPYITLTTDASDVANNCSFHRDTVFAIEPNQRPGIVQIDSRGRARRFANLPSSVQPNGIVFDTTGHFGHQLLVTAGSNGGTTVFAVACTGNVTTIVRHSPVVEGGIAVAPPSFGRFGGDLIAPSEGSGRVFALKPNGTAVTLIQSHLPSGGDIGVESAGFVPSGFGPRGDAYLADRFSAGNRHPGTDSILRLPGSELAKAGVHAGDLLVASEGGAKTIVVRCEAVCTVRHIADGPAVAHGEGHIAFSVSAL